MWWEGRESIVYTAANLSQTHALYQLCTDIYQGRLKLQCFSFSFSLSFSSWSQADVKALWQANYIPTPPAEGSDAQACLRSISCCCSWALLDGLFKWLHMLGEIEGMEGCKTAEYIKQTLRTTFWSSERENGIIKSKWFHPIFWAPVSRQSPFTFMIGCMGWELNTLKMRIHMEIIVDCIKSGTFNKLSLFH